MFQGISSNLPIHLLLVSFCFKNEECHCGNGGIIQVDGPHPKLNSTGNVRSPSLLTLIQAWPNIFSIQTGTWRIIPGLVSG